MKKLFKLSLFASICLLILNACQREKIVLEELEPENKIVVHCYLDADSGKQIVCKIYRANPVFGHSNTENIPISNAQVEIGKNGQWTQIPLDMMGQDYRLVPEPGFLENNQNYELKITHPDYPEAHATIKLLPKYQAEILSGKIQLQASDSINNQKLNYELSWIDEPGVKNFYRIIPLVGYINIDFPSDTIFMPPSYGKLILINDVNTNGNTINWKGQTDFYPFGENGFQAVCIKMYILHIDENYFNYHRVIQELSTENAMVEPSFFKGNISHAYGIFAACNGLSEKTFPLQ